MHEASLWKMLLVINCIKLNLRILLLIGAQLKHNFSPVKNILDKVASTIIMHHTFFFLLDENHI